MFDHLTRFQVCLDKQRLIIVKMKNRVYLTLTPLKRKFKGAFKGFDYPHLFFPLSLLSEVYVFFPLMQGFI